MLDRNALGEFLRAARFATGLTMVQVGGELGLSHKWVSNLETGFRVTIDRDLLDRIAYVYDIDPIEVHAKAIESSAAARGEVRLDVGDPPSEQGLLAVELAQHWTNMQPSTAKALLLILRGRES